MLTRLKLVSVDRGSVLANPVYDWMAKMYVDRCDIFHFVNGVGLHSAQKAKRQGSVAVCDVRSVHPGYRDAILREEYETLCIPYQSRPDLFLQRNEAEYATADYLIIPSSFAAETLVHSGVDGSRIYVVPRGVDLGWFGDRGASAEGPQRDRPFRILCVGRIVPSKGVHYLLKAFEKLDAPDAELVLIGGVGEAMRDLVARAMEQDPRILAFGYIPHLELRRYYGSGSVFVLPTLFEGSALVIYEAMASGLPVITTPNAGSIVRNDVDGFLVPIRDAEALKERLTWLYEHPKQCMDMGQVARERVSDYTWERYGERLLEAYSDILHREGRSAICN
jgi:glycosyltransferase involved in cell wall biosynthesis